MKLLLAKIREILRDRRNRQLFTRIVSVTAAVVVFITTYALVLPAITMETEANCGIPAHQHDDSCYEEQLICGQAEDPGHHHTDACYTTLTSLICTETEHQHDDSCYDEGGNLICELSEHTHDDACYEETRELTCGMEESDGHQHTDACYDRVLTCGLEAHTHSAACYSHASEGAAGRSGASAEDYAVVAATTEAAGEHVRVPGDAANSNNPDNIDGGDNIAVDAAGTGLSGLPAEEDTYVPELEPLFFDQILTQKTGIYYFHPEEGEMIPENTADITDWFRVKDDTDLAPADMLRVYLRYTIPAGSLNSTNPVARYRLPSNLHLTDEQMEEINTNVNGIANQYVNLDTLEILDPDQYNQYLGIEAVEGTRTPADDINEYFDKHPDMNAQEYINATVQAENVYDTEGLYGEKDAYLGQDLIFTFTPYTIQKNQHEYDADGQPTKAGEKVDGWLCFDVRMDQIDWGEPVISTIEDDSATPAQDVLAENTEDIENSDTAEATEKATSDMDEDASLSSSDPDALNTNTITEKKESSAEVLFAAKDKTLKIDEISTKLHLVELNTIEKENDAAQDEPDQSADDSTGNANSEMTDGKDDKADDSDSEGETDKSGSADDSATDTENQPESEMEINAETYPAVSFEDTITVQAGTLSTDNENAAKETPAETAITVSVIAEEETFPLGTTMQLSTVEDLDTVASAVEGAVEGQTRGFHAVDISFRNTDGEEIEPLKPIKVSMTSEAIKQAVEDSSTAPVVVHLENSSEVPAKNKDSAGLPANSTDAEENSANINLQSDREDETSENTPIATIIETNEPSNINGSSESTETADTLSFDAGSFSVYAIVYTVDFHYEVNGKIYEFSIPGGGFVSLEHLVEVLGIGVNDTKLENEATELETNGESALDHEETRDDAESREVGSNAYDDAIKLNEVKVSETAKNFVADVERVEFSNQKLVWTGKVNEPATVGELKETNGLAVEYSANLTEEQIAEINAQTVNAGDWALISVRPFTSEETVAVTMKNGEKFTIRVTDANITKENLVPDSGYVIYTKVGDTYYVLKTDGTTKTYSSTVDLDGLSNDYKWKFTYVYTENGIQRYNIRPYTDKSVSLSLNYSGNDLVENGPNNITIVPTQEGSDSYVFGGFHNTKLKLNGSDFAGVNDGTYSPIYIYDLEPLHQYQFSVITNSSTMGKVSGKDSSGTQRNSVDLFTATTNYTNDVAATKTNKDAITAVPDISIQGAGNTGSKYVFDHWELNGETIYSRNGNLSTNPTGNGWSVYKNTTIQANKLTIPANASTLTAVFAESKTYKPKDKDKQGTKFKDMESWLSELQRRNIPLNQNGCKKTAEVYDYENRIYRVDLTAQSSLTTFDGTIDLGFILDVSKSMEFPSKMEVVSGKESYSIYRINENNNFKDFDTGKTYYLIGDINSTATVFELWAKDTGNYVQINGVWQRKYEWWAVDASKGRNHADARKIGEGSLKTGWISSASKYYYSAGDGIDTTYPIYEATRFNDNGTLRTRLDDLKDSMSGTVNALNRILYLLSIVDETKTTDARAKDPNVKLAWMTFNKRAPARADKNDPSTIVTSERNSSGKVIFKSGQDYQISTEYTTDGGTNTLGAIQWTGENFKWEDSTTRYAVLITDGAPQGGDDIETDNANIISGADTALKGHADTDDDIQLITVGLSMGNVDRGRILLHDLADNVNGEKAFYSAESGDQLEDILLHILDTIMVPATVIGNVSDTIGEAFYPVDLKTGRPLKDNDEIDLDGNCVTGDTSYTGLRGKIVKTGKTYKVEWDHQDIPWEGWHGTVYVKSKEDFLGGNAVPTNNDAIGKAEVVATHYKTSDKQNAPEYPLANKAYILDENKNKIENPNYKLTADMPTPHVNVNELQFLQNDSEWTVYLGTNVDPKSQIQGLYNSIEVEEVIKKGSGNDADSNDLPEQVKDTENKASYSYNMEESISDQREPKQGATETFLLRDVIRSLVDNKGYSSVSWWDYEKQDLRWDELIRMANLADQSGNTGLVIPYNAYGMKDNSNIVIKLTKDVKDGEEDDLNISPHSTAVTGEGVEKYKLYIIHSPDYTTVSVGQGGEASTAKSYRTGGYGTAYQGHAAGTEESTNNHLINVYVKPLDVLKLDHDNQTLQNAEFTLYRAASGNETGVELNEYDPSLTDRYIEVSKGRTDEHGIVRLADGSTLQKSLLPGIEYYLIETDVPEGYERESAYKLVTVDTADNSVLTDLSGESIDEQVYPYNWQQGVRILVDNTPAIYVDAENAEHELAADAYADPEEAVVFRTEVLNRLKSTYLDVTKSWVDKVGRNKAENGHTITFKVTRKQTAEGTAEDVVLTSVNLPGASVNEYMTLNNDGTVTLTYHDGWPTASIVRLPQYVPGTNNHTEWIYNVVETAHTPAEKEVTTTYNKVTTGQNATVTIVNTEPEKPVKLDVQKKWLNADGSDWTNPTESEIKFVLYRVSHIPCEHNWVETVVPATCETNGSITHTCSKCNEVETETILATGHDWGEWEIVERATYDHPTGTQKRVCKNDPSHVETETYTIEDHTCTYGEWEITDPATCTEPGLRTRYCTICLRPETETIPALGHDYSSMQITPATCTEPGSIVRTCSHDASHTTTEVIEATGHDWGPWEVTTPPTVNAPGVETRTCRNDPSHKETRPIAQLSNTTTVTINVNKKSHTGYLTGITYYRNDYQQTTGTYPVGSTLRITWTYDDGHYGPDCWYKENSYRAYIPTQGYSLSGPQKEVTRTIPYDNDQDTTYSIDVVVTADLVIDLCVDDTWSKPLPNPTITVLSNSGARGNVLPAGRVTAFRQRLEPAVLITAAQAETSETEPDHSPVTILTEEQLQTIISGFKTPEQAAGEDNVDVIERVGSYTITSGEQWTKSFNDLPRSDANGNVYTYYVVETSPSTGYEITYAGQNNGLSDGGSVTINNKRTRGALKITKEVTVNNGDPTDANKSRTNGTYKFAVAGVPDTGTAGALHTISITFADGKAVKYQVDSGAEQNVTGTDNTWEVLIPNLMPGTYTVTETDSGDLTLKTVTGTSVADNVATVTVVAGDDTASEASAQVTFKNNGTEYEIVIVKADTENTTTRLGGAVFDLYAESSIENNAVKENETPIRSNLTTASTNDEQKGKVSLGRLSEGTYYLVETKAPSGYILPAEPIAIVITESGVSLLQGSSQQAATITQDKAEALVYNSAGAELPSTGGSGTTLLYLLGIMLAGLASACLVLRTLGGRADYGN